MHLQRRETCQSASAGTDKHQLAINLNTAKASLLVRADEVIE
jgi:hypothetical protein